VTGRLVTQVRRAGRPDARVMAMMRWAFRTELGTPVESERQFVERATTWLADRLELGSWTGWLAVEREDEQEHEQEEPVGLVLAHLLEKVPNPVVEPESIGYVSSLYVRPGCRDGGIGDVLLRTAVDFCRDHGADTVVLWPSPRSFPLYARHGFRRRGEVMELHWAAEPETRLGP